MKIWKCARKACSMFCCLALMLSLMPAVSASDVGEDKANTIYKILDKDCNQTITSDGADNSAVFSSEWVDEHYRVVSIRWDISDPSVATITKDIFPEADAVGISAAEVTAMPGLTQDTIITVRAVIRYKDTSGTTCTATASTLLTIKASRIPSSPSTSIGQKPEETPHAHNYTSQITKQPTASQPGVRTYACSTCGDTYTEEIPATGTTAGTSNLPEGPGYALPIDGVYVPFTISSYDADRQGQTFQFSVCHSRGDLPMMRVYDQSGADISNCNLFNVAYGSKIQNISTSDGSNQIEFVLCTAEFSQQYRANIQLSDKTTILRENDTLYGLIDGYNVIGAKGLVGYNFFYLENQAETQATQHLHKTPVTPSGNTETNQQEQEGQKQPQTGGGQQQTRPNQGMVSNGGGSGSFSLPKLSKQEIADLLNLSAPIEYSGQVYDVQPSVSAPYSSGRLSNGVLQAALDRLNALRRIAGLPATRLERDWCESAQYGAVILAKIGDLDHTPSQPSDMDDAFYKKAYGATRTSNLSAGWTLVAAVDSLMRDYTASNIQGVGHRRWQLSPALTKVGFGFAESDNKYRSFTDEKVFDLNESYSEGSLDYNYISWPASGYFPNDLTAFSGDIPWSVSLNPDSYQMPSGPDISVTLTRESDGKSWNFSGRDSYTPADSGRYFLVSGIGYGVGPCVIFRPDGISKYEGVYSVKIDGLRDSSGNAVDLSYQVDFFSTKSAGTTPTTPTTPTNPTAPANPTQPTTPTNPTTPTSPVSFTDVKSNDWFKPYVEKAAQAGLVNGIGNGKYDPQGNLTVAQAMVLAYQIDSKATGRELPEASGAWYMPYYQYCLDNGIVNRNSFSQSSLTRTASRYDMVNILDKSVPASRMTAVKTVTSIPDVPRSGNDIVYKWYQAGILAGDTQGRFNGSSNITRAEVAVILCKLNETATRPIENTDNFSTEYMSGPYYRALKNATLTGNYRTDIIAIATSQIGYCEGDNEGQLDGTYRGSSDYTEYGRFLNSDGSAWCSEFASWCARMADVPTNILKSSRGASAKAFGAPYYSWNQTVFAGGNYMPKPGDLALWAWTGTSHTDEYLSHTSIVCSVHEEGDTVIITTIDGNSNNSVNKVDNVLSAHDGSCRNGHLVYFVAPDYD